jgi:4-hydroxy-tetrahydrodipicolinate reductase
MLPAMLRILHVGLGPLGIKICTDLHERCLGRVVAAVDVAPGMAGKRLVDLVPTAAADVVVRADLDVDPRSYDAAIVTTSSDMARCGPTFGALLERGACIVSTCEELAWPYLRHAALAAELDALARKTGGRLLGFQIIAIGSDEGC